MLSNYSLHVLLMHSSHLKVLSFVATSCEGEKDYRAVLSHLQAQVSSNVSHMVICRTRVLQSTLTAVRRPNFSIGGQIAVQFSGEEAEDCGGPRREYLR